MNTCSPNNVPCRTSRISRRHVIHKAMALSATAWAIPVRAQAEPAALLQSFDLSNLQIPESEILAGGPPKDGIPAITVKSGKMPELAPAGGLTTLKADDRIVSLRIGNTVQGYPLSILNWHEIVNAEIEGVPFAVIYCPLCDSVTVVRRKLGDETFEFGVSGLLFNSNVLLYDRQNHALWSQLGFRAVSGPHAGRSLETLPDWSLTQWKNWRQKHPDAMVLTSNTGFRRDYNRNPYEAYFRTDRLMFPVKKTNAALPAKTPVLGIRIGAVAKAYPIDLIRRQGGEFQDIVSGHLIRLRIDNEQIVILQAPDHAQTSHAFWFAWHAFWPDTQIYTSPNPAR